MPSSKTRINYKIYLLHVYFSITLAISLLFLSPAELLEYCSKLLISTYVPIPSNRPLIIPRSINNSEATINC